MLSINNAGVNDIPTIREITYLVWPQTYDPIVGAEQVTYMIDLFYTPDALTQQMESQHRFIICKDDDIAVGFASYSQTEPGTFKIHKLYVLPDQQGKGIGKLLVGHITNELKNEGIKRLILNVNRYNTSAITFYDKAGFSMHSEEDIAIGNGYYMNDYVLELILQ